MNNYIKYGVITLMGIIILIGAKYAPIKHGSFSHIMNVFTIIIGIMTILGGLGGILIWTFNKNQLNKSYEEVKLHKQTSNLTISRILYKTITIAISVIVVVMLLSYINNSAINWVRTGLSVICCSFIYFLILILSKKHKGHEN